MYGRSHVVFRVLAISRRLLRFVCYETVDRWWGPRLSDAAATTASLT